MAWLLPVLYGVTVLDCTLAFPLTHKSTVFLWYIKPVYVFIVALTTTRCIAANQWCNLKAPGLGIRDHPLFVQVLWLRAENNMLN